MSNETFPGAALAADLGRLRDGRDTVLFYRDPQKEWRWKRTASNGEVVGASTEGYKNFSEAQANLERQGHSYLLDVE